MSEMLMENQEDVVEEESVIVEDHDQEKVAMLQEIEQEFVTRRQACDMLGIKVTNTAKALDCLPEYKIFDRILYTIRDVESLAAVRLSKNENQAKKRQEALDKMRKSMEVAQERAKALAARIQAASNGEAQTDYSANKIDLNA